MDRPRLDFKFLQTGIQVPTLLICSCVVLVRMYYTSSHQGIMLHSSNIILKIKDNLVKVLCLLLLWNEYGEVRLYLDSD